uniref:cyclin-dependent kinase n=1 Tax=Ditylenchus dipsaci TaxID=166011 RepID=A0A915CUJ1_9BILA
MRNAKDYEMLHRLGEGAYGTVYLVTHVPTQSQYALKKVIMKNNDDGISQNVLREIASIVSLKNFEHPNIIKIHDAFVSKAQQDMCLDIIFEKCDWDLQEFLRSIPEDMCDGQCRHLAKQIFAGIDFLHSNSVIHRDLKPQNILVNRDQSVKIADFGLARNYGLHSTFTTVVVTLHYRSPEILLQSKYNTSADIWSADRGSSTAHHIPKPGHSSTFSLACRCSGGQIFLPQLSSYSTSPACSKASARAIELANEILKFNPHQRPTAAECLQHPYFA